MTRRTPPLNTQLPMVDPQTGNPTPFFMRWWQEQIETNAFILDLTDPAEVSTVLDTLGSPAVRGAILYRGDDGGTPQWKLLAPGTSGYALVSQGAGADPIYAALAATFLELTDTPSSYSGQTGNAIRVNAGETALEFYDPATVVTETEVIAVALGDETTALTTGTGKITFRIPYDFTLTDVRASLTTAGTGANLVTVDINANGTSILSTKLTLDATERTSTTAATPAVISTSSLADDDEITIDVDQIDSGAVAAGLKVYLIGTRAVNRRAWQIAVSDETTALTTGTAKVTWRAPYALTVTEVRASLTTAGTTSGTVTVDINESGSTILSTKLTIDNGETTSTTAATPPVISDSAIADDAELTIDIDAVDTGGTSAGLKVTIIGVPA